uniref:Uncharacterized protein n=1 Tax=Candidatus Kentrum sp. TUN TaxID=2126343 RepID=A0A451AF39_9GAMM|nr:MAG: hypothetical protein BECKTUN1418F_GA0071002_10859 [Candidatus Kentron sp. TUN]VFK62609.1 MAG: hypothetical protein BECKTUN1418E_GA0071001_10839 [Candidatus Kentron sp. TUN]VFK64584.1 MAG: hypothetical protein BECKTUN1418D_GA0071000_12734 [Candidatus Kentron sp. TUN]
MSALRAETERGLALSYAWVLSGFLFFRYMNETVKNFIELSSHCCAMDLLPWEEFRTQKISPYGRDDR